MDFRSKQIAPPKSWADFEDLCLAIFRAEWKDPLAQKNGRSGQPQHGVDVYGSPRTLRDKFHGIQCKGKDRSYDGKATVSELMREVAKAEKFAPKLQHWIFATTAPRDATLQQAARELSVKRKAQGLFTVTALGWEDIQSLLARHPEVIRQFYPEQGYDISAVLDTLRALPSGQDLKDMLESLKRLVEAEPGSRPIPPPAIDARDEFSQSNITIAPPKHFMGKEEAFASVEAALKQGERDRAIVALHGLPGLGKTAVATGYAERHAQDYRATWWIRAENDFSMRADLVALGVRLGWTHASAKENSALEAVMERLRVDGEKLLLVYDNAINVNQVKPYLPPGGAAHVLITSNDPTWRSIAEPIEIRVWSKEMGAKYLLLRTGRKTEPAAYDLSEMLGGLPLALEQAAAYCEHLGVSFAEYYKHFEAAPVRLLDDEHHAPAEYHNGLTLAKTLWLAIREAKKLHPAAEPLLVHAAILPPEPIPLVLFSEATDKFRDPQLSALVGDGLDRTVAALRAFALVGRELIADERDETITTDSIRLHRLVRWVALDLWTEEERQEARYSLLEALAAIYPKLVWQNPHTWPRTRRLDPLALALVNEGDISDPKVGKLAADLLTWGGQYRQYALAAYAEAQLLFERALTIRQKLFGVSHSETAISYNSLGGVLQGQGQLAAAREAYERAVEIREDTLPPEHSDTAMSLNNLADVLRAQGEAKKAWRMYGRAFAIWQKVHGLDHPYTSTSLRNIARILQDQGKLDEARPLLELSLAIREKELGADHAGTATNLENLATLLQAQGDHRSAELLYERALGIQLAELGAEHPRTAMCHCNYGRLLCDIGKIAKADLHLLRAVTIGKKKLGDGHPETQRYQCQYARLLLMTYREADALALGEAALATHAAAHGPSHFWTRESASVTADALDALGRQDEAAALRKKYQIEK